MNHQPNEQLGVVAVAVVLCRCPGTTGHTEAAELLFSLPSHDDVTGSVARARLHVYNTD
jgi:hypothetical protein